MPEKRSFTYFLLGNVTPVRVARDASGLVRSAEAPDPETGELVYRHTLLSRLDTSPEVEELTELQFEEACAAIRAKRSEASR
jgi:hypothetical protein